MRRKGARWEPCSANFGILEGMAPEERSVFRPGLLLALAGPIALLVAAPGCALLGVRSQQQAIARLARIRGEVHVEPPTESPIVVVLTRASRPGGTEEPGAHIVDHYRLAGAGVFTFVVTPGSFRIGAFADPNQNLVYDPGEPVMTEQRSLDVQPGEALDDLTLVVPRESRIEARYDISAIQSRTPSDQQNFSLRRFTVRGEVVSLDDPRFGAAAGKLGMWRFADFLFEVGPGIYFLAAYDPERIPVLFVHGIGGHPQAFAPLIAALDRERFQPWFYFYPSGIHLDELAHHLSDTLASLQTETGFEELAVVAHSMGGLVARASILESFARTGRRDVRAFVALSTPWGGSEGAAMVDRAPRGLVVDSWLDMRPGSAFLTDLFHEPSGAPTARTLPDHVAFHMLFGFARHARSFGPSGDGVLSLASMARSEAVSEARSVLPIDCDHAGILRHPEASSRLTAILDEVFR
jgi:pimeloyl-ACP methyl ester carboxylesterase